MKNISLHFCLPVAPNLVGLSWMLSWKQAVHQSGPVQSQDSKTPPRSFKTTSDVPKLAFCFPEKCQELVLSCVTELTQGSKDLPSQREEDFMSRQLQVATPYSLWGLEMIVMWRKAKQTSGLRRTGTSACHRRPCSPGSKSVQLLFFPLWCLNFTKSSYVYVHIPKIHSVIAAIWLAFGRPLKLTWRKWFFSLTITSFF